MKKSKKYILSTLLVIGIITSLVKVDIANAETINIDNNQVCNIPILSTIGKIKKDNTIIIDGIETETFCTFESQSEALKNIKNDCSELLDEMKKYYQYEDMNENNWKYYYNVLEDYMHLLNNDGIKKLNSQYYQLRAFFDIYENVESNNEIQEYVNETSTRRTSLLIDEGFLGLLPYHSKIVKSYIENKLQTYATPGSFDISKAINYAKTYAVSSNSNEYGHLSHGDCANFVSQIYYVAGKQQDYTGNTYSGWWHTKNGNSHLHSRTWAYANDFSLFWGIRLTTPEVRLFSENIQQGDAVAIDHTKDGSWDHMGFVTATTRNLKIATGGAIGGMMGTATYYDFEIAQHTKNYIAYASTDDNSWENAGILGGQYAIIGR